VQRASRAPAPLSRSLTRAAPPQPAERATERHGRQRPAARRAAAAPLLLSLALLALAVRAAAPPPRRAAARRLAQAPSPLPPCDGVSYIQVENQPAKVFQASPSSASVPVPWTAAYRLPDFPATDYFYFTVPDNFTVITVTAAILNFRHYRANDVVLTLMAPGNANEVFLVNRPCRSSASLPGTFGAAPVTASAQVNATSAGDTYYFGDFTFNPPGSIQGNQCPFNEMGINPIAGGISTYGYYQPMNANFPGFSGTVVNNIYLGAMPGTMSVLAGGNAAGVWRMRYSDAATPCALRSACVLRF